MGTSLPRATDTVALAGVSELIAHPAGARIFAVAGDKVTTYLLDRFSGVLSDPRVTTLASPITQLSLSGNGRWAAVVLSSPSTTITILDLSADGQVQNTPIVSAALFSNPLWADWQSSGGVLYTLEPGSVLKSWVVNGSGALSAGFTAAPAPPAGATRLLTLKAY
jgi:hypothetical protein